MPNIVTLSVENPDQILNTGAYGAGALIRLQTATTEGGIFADVAGTGSTPTTTVVTGTNSYTGYDPAGTASSWYRSRFENVGATRLSDWSPAFQVGDETAGMLCSVYDVSQRMFGTSTTSANNTEQIIEIIKGVSADIEGFVGRWLAPRPTNPASETTLLFDVAYQTRSLLLERGRYVTGIRSASVIGIASTSQPESGGSYTSATLADILFRPRPSTYEPGNRLVFTTNPTGGVTVFNRGYNVVSVTGTFGFAVVPPDIQEVAIAAVTKRFLSKETAAPMVALGPDGGVTILGDISPAQRATLARYKWPVGA